MKKLISYLSIAFCTVLTLSSCDKEEIAANKLLGTWEWVSTITYNPDGTFEGEYANSSNGYCLTFTEDIIKSDDSEALPYTFDGKNIYLLGGLLTWEVEELTKKKMKIRELTAFDNETYSITEYKKK